MDWPGSSEQWLIPGLGQELDSRDSMESSELLTTPGSRASEAAVLSQEVKSRLKGLLPAKGTMGPQPSEHSKAHMHVLRTT